MLEKHSLIFSVFRAQYRSGAAAFFPMEVLQYCCSMDQSEVRGQLHFVKAGLLCPLQSTEDSTPGALYLHFGRLYSRLFTVLEL